MQPNEIKLIQQVLINGGYLSLPEGSVDPSGKWDRATQHAWDGWVFKNLSRSHLATSAVPGQTPTRFINLPEKFKNAIKNLVDPPKSSNSVDTEPKPDVLTEAVHDPSHETLTVTEILKTPE